MKDWNVIVTVTDRFGYRHARRRLGQFGVIEGTPFYNVLVMHVTEIGGFLTAVAEMVSKDKSLLNDISRLVPAQVTFDFKTREEFESRASAVILDWAHRLAGGTFHVRLHRRGLGDQLASPTEEKLLDERLLQRLAEAGHPGRINFDDPDHVIDIETVGNRAGLSLWTRDDLRRFPFLRVD